MTSLKPLIMVRFPMTVIYIYQDYVHNNGGLYNTLSLRYGKENVRFIDADELKNGALTSRINAFIMPGGASRYVSDKLNGAGNQAIRDYVAQGGLYIGICAGAYYGCRRTEWQPGFDQRFLVDNELGFFPGTASGPVMAFASPDNPHHMAAITPIETHDGQRHAVLYWAGPVFEDVTAEVEVLARYASLPDQPAAVIAGHFHQGRYLLCSPHLELNSHQINLMTFDVPDNRFEEFEILADRDQIMSHDYFFSLLDRFIR